MSRILTADYIEFGEVNVHGNVSRIALVQGRYEIEDVNAKDYEEYIGNHGDYIDLDMYDGDIFFREQRHIEETR